ncbi:MAG: transporter substrate-binding domain-containing protein [Lachnospiraceae bacterium]|nr:transporter substrate-binding domain-containing protein [Lachnospiraceae bacterium]
MFRIQKECRNRFFCRLLVVVFILLTTVSFLPADTFAAEADAVTVRVGYYENEVFEEGAEDGAIKTGYAYEYYRKISEYTGWKYEYVYGDFNDLYQMLLDGEIDLLAGLAWKEDRSDLIGYPNLPMGNETYNLVKHIYAEDITSDPSTMSGKKIGVLDSAMVDVLNQYLESNEITASISTYTDYTVLFEDFDAGKLDIIAAEGDGAYGRDDAEVLLPFGTSDYFLCVNKDRQDLLAQLNHAQSTLSTEEPNYLYTLNTKYYSGSISARAFSSVEKEWLASHKTLHVGYLENYLPYSGTDEQGEVTGIVKDIIPEILKGLGISDITVSYTGYESYDAMIADMTAAKIDVAFPVGGGLYFSEENGLYQSLPVASAPTELVHKGAYSEETTAHFAVNENNRMQYYFVRSNFPDAEITMYPSIDACLEAVVNGEVSCSTLNGLRANDMLKNSKYRDLALYQLARNDDRCFGVEIGNEGLLKLLNRGINVIGNDYAQNISYRYTGGLYSYNLKDAFIDHIAVFGTLFLAIGAFIIYLLARSGRRTKKQMIEKEAFNARLEEKNLELEASQKELADALVAAESANRAKTTFLNNMSHDIRTPMNAIVGFTSLAESHIDDKEQVQDYLGRISVSSQHLLSLINDVLDMSRIESGKMTLEESDVHLPELVHNLQTIIQENANAKQLALSFDSQDVVHEDIVTDKLRLNQVLLNILSNAVKFTPNGGTISFCVREKESTSKDVANFEFRIKDTGIGMSKEFQKSIFEAFTREKTSTVSGIQGTGLGMAITKSIIDMMGGTISVQSEEGAGSEFIVNLPCRISSHAAFAESEAKIQKDTLAGKRVLLAEDNEMNQMIAETILTESGLLVEIADNGEIAVEKMNTQPAGYYDIVLMDIQMPKMDGYEAARQIRNMTDPAKANIPIVAVTANAFEEDKNTALESGMNGHLAKPYDIPKIMETLESLIK